MDNFCYLLNVVLLLLAFQLHVLGHNPNIVIVLKLYPWSQCSTISELVVMVQAYIRISLEIRTLCTEAWKFDALEFHSVHLPLPIRAWVANLSLSTFLILKMDIKWFPRGVWRAILVFINQLFKAIWVKGYYDLGNWGVCNGCYRQVRILWGPGRFPAGTLYPQSVKYI